MWRQLSPAEQAKLLGTAMISVSLLTMSAAVGYFSYTIYITQRNVPAILAQVEATTKAVKPALDQVEPMREMIPDILEEVAATREMLPQLLNTTAKSVHEVTTSIHKATTSIDKVERHIPVALAEVHKTRQALPGLLDRTQELADSAGKSVHEASTSINNLGAQIPSVLTEVRETRQMIPGLMDRAEKLVESAGKAGQEASKGAVVGVVGGILVAPFKIIGGVGKGIFGSMTDTGNLTKQDENLAIEAADSLVRTGKEGSEASWKNPDSKNRGTVRLVRKSVRDEQTCYKFHHEVVLASKQTQTTDLEFCQKKDGTWIQRK